LLITQTVRHSKSGVFAFVQTLSYSKFLFCGYRKIVANFFASAVCTNRRTVENLNYLRFLQTVEQFDSEKKVDHRRPPPPIHHNYLYNLKLNLQWCLPSFQLLEWVPKWWKLKFVGYDFHEPWMENKDGEPS